IARGHAARVQVAPLAPGDELLGDRAQGLGLDLGGLDAAMGEQGRRHVAERRATVRARPVQLLESITVAPLNRLNRLAGQRPGCERAALSTGRHAKSQGEKRMEPATTNKPSPIPLEREVPHLLKVVVWRSSQTMSAVDHHHVTAAPQLESGL